AHAAGLVARAAEAAAYVRDVRVAGVGEDLAGALRPHPALAADHELRRWREVTLHDGEEVGVELRLARRRIEEHDRDVPRAGGMTGLELLLRADVEVEGGRITREDVVHLGRRPLGAVHARG